MHHNTDLQFTRRKDMKDVMIMAGPLLLHWIYIKLLSCYTFRNLAASSKCKLQNINGLFEIISSCKGDIFTRSKWCLDTPTHNLK